MQPPEVMTIDELAEYLKVSKSSLYKLAQQGKVPGQKVGKHWRFHKNAIDSWISSSPIELTSHRAKRQQGGASDE